MSIIVVGAGPAGATAARALARAGVAVRLLDRAEFPRNKPCGGGISARVLRRFPYLRPELSRISTHTVSRLYLEGPTRKGTIVESAEPAALMIRRVEFDALLVSLAVQAGADLVTGADVVHAAADDRGVVLVARDGRRFEASIVVAADGVHSVIARRLGLNPGWRRSDLALDLMEETTRASLRDVDPATLWVAYGYEPDREDGPRKSGARKNRRESWEPAAEGYAYIFPKRDHVNVGIGYVLDHYRRAIDRPPYALQRSFVDELRARGIVEGESVRGNFTPFLIPVGGPLRRPGRGRVLVVGDAGGFVNGVTAEGIYYAMVTGELGAQAIIETMSTGNGIAALARRYRRACDDEIGSELKDSVYLRRYLFADRRRIAHLIEGVVREPALTKGVVDFAIGLLPYRSLRRRMLAAAPFMAGQLIWQWARTKLLSAKFE